MQLQGIIFDELAKVTQWFPVFFTFFAIVVLLAVICQTILTPAGQLATDILYLLYPLEGVLSSVMYFRTVPGAWTALLRWPCSGSRHKHVRIMTRVEEIEASYISATDAASTRSRGSLSGVGASAPYVRFTEDFEYDQGDHVALEDMGSETWSLVPSS